MRTVGRCAGRLLAGLRERAVLDLGVDPHVVEGTSHHGHRGRAEARAAGVRTLEVAALRGSDPADRQPHDQQQRPESHAVGSTPHWCPDPTSAADVPQTRVGSIFSARPCSCAASPRRCSPPAAGARPGAAQGAPRPPALAPPPWCGLPAGGPPPPAAGAPAPPGGRCWQPPPAPGEHTSRNWSGSSCPKWSGLRRASHAMA